MKKLLIAAALAAVIAGPVAAQAYVGVGAGTANEDSNNTSWKVYGGYQFSPIWGAEMAYNNLDRKNANIENVTLAGTATLALNPSWALLGKVGVAVNHSRDSGFSDHSDLLLGAGIAYNMSKNLGLRLEYEDFGKLATSNNAGDLTGHNLALSLKYGF